MAVYTQLGAEQLVALIAQYDVGNLVMAKGIAEGVSNSNWLIETSGSAGAAARGGGGNLRAAPGKARCGSGRTRRARHF
jgi:homoserine kinase type II